MPATNLRSGRRVALLAAVQSAKGTPSTAFASAAVWRTHSTEIPVSPEKSSETWMAEPVAAAPEERFTIADRPAGRLDAVATPDVLDLLLRSNWGPKSGSSYTLKTQVNEWLTLAWVEWAAAASVGQVARIQDAWVHRLVLRAGFPRGFLMATGAFLGRRILIDPKGSGGLAFPASWAPEGNPFTVNAAAFIRDPAGANVSIRLRELEVLFDQRAAPHDWDMGSLLFMVHKAGPAEVTAEFRAEVSDEAWATITDARAGTKRAFRFTASAQSPAKTLTVNLNEMDFTFRELGHDGKDMREIVGKGRAHLSAGVPATISLV
jgi:hypothetical protein